jgi:DNA-binding transcriptional LysR family regulator
LRIAVVTTSKYFMPRVLGPYCARYPGVDVAMEVVNRDRLLERPSRNEDDLYVMGAPPEDWEIQSEPLIENPLVVVGPASHPMAGRRQIPSAELGGEVFIMREQGTPLRVKMALGSNEAIKQAVAGGLGIAILSRSALTASGGGGQLAELDVRGFPIRRHWYLVRPKGKQLSVVARTFVKFLQEHVRLLETR